MNKAKSKGTAITFGSESIVESLPEVIAVQEEVAKRWSTTGNYPAIVSNAGESDPPNLQQDIARLRNIKPTLWQRIKQLFDNTERIEL